MTIWTSEFGRDDLASAVERLRLRRPPRRREVVCHGDLQPFNVLVHREHVTVIDWTAALVAEPAYDLAYTALTMSLAPVDAPRPVQAAAAAGGRAFSRRFLRVYQDLGGGSGLEEDTFAWYTALQTLRSLLDGARNLAAGAPHPFIAAAPLLEARLVNVAQCHKVGVTLFLEIADVLAANQTVPDEADLHPVVCAGNARIGGRTERCEESPAGGSIRISYAHSIREYHRIRRLIALRRPLESAWSTRFVTRHTGNAGHAAFR